MFISPRALRLRLLWAAGLLCLLGVGPLGPLGPFHAEVKADVCVGDPHGQAGLAPSMGAAPWHPVDGSPAHCAVCHWLHSLRAFTAEPVVANAGANPSTPLPPRMAAPARCGTTTHLATRAPPAESA